MTANRQYVGSNILAALRGPGALNRGAPYGGAGAGAGAGAVTSTSAESLLHTAALRRNSMNPLYLESMRGFRMQHAIDAAIGAQEERLDQIAAQRFHLEQQGGLVGSGISSSSLYPPPRLSMDPVSSAMIRKQVALDQVARAEAELALAQDHKLGQRPVFGGLGRAPMLSPYSSRMMGIVEEERLLAKRQQQGLVSQEAHMWALKEEAQRQRQRQRQLMAVRVPSMQDSSQASVSNKRRRDQEDATKQSQVKKKPRIEDTMNLSLNDIATKTLGRDPRTKTRTHAEAWSTKFGLLIEFKAEHGHCRVPRQYKHNVSLGRWVKMQRHQFKLRNEGSQSSLTPERIAALEKVGFVWEPHASIWEERLEELRDFRKATGHANVPSNDHENSQLAAWVKRQRQQYKLFSVGAPCSLTQEQVDRLEETGFQWNFNRQPAWNKGLTRDGRPKNFE